MSTKPVQCSVFLQEFMAKHDLFSLTPISAEDFLVEHGIINRNGEKQRGLTLRNIIRSNPKEFIGAHQFSKGSSWTIYNKRIIGLRVAWMKEYAGTTAYDIPVGAGSYVSENKDGGEAYNFQNISGDYLGYARNQKDRNYKIEHLGAFPVNQHIDNVTVVFFATNPITKGQFIVGWYKQARFYRSLQKTKVGRGNRPEYICSTHFQNGHLLPPKDRVFRIPNNPKHKPGQTNHWYLMGEPWHRINEKIWEYIFSKQPPEKPNSRKDVRPWQPDIEIRRKVELAAMDATADYFENRGFSIYDVSKCNVGWDLEARFENENLKLEVKGLSGELGSIELTPNEYKNSKRKDFRLCILENALLSSKKLSVLNFDFSSRKWISDEGLILGEKERISAIVGV